MLQKVGSEMTGNPCFQEFDVFVGGGKNKWDVVNLSDGRKLLLAVLKSNTPSIACYLRSWLLNGQKKPHTISLL